MERRTLLAVFLAFIVVYVYQAYIAPPESPKTVASTTQTPQTPSQASAVAIQNQQLAEAAPAGVDGANPVVAEADVVLENEDVKAVFSTRGARLKAWVLKRYMDKVGAPVNLVASGVPDSQPKPLELEADQAEVTRGLNQGVYGFRLEDQDRRVVFELNAPSGLVVKKVFSLGAKGFVLDAQVAARQGELVVPVGLVWGSGLGDLGATTGGGFFSRDVARAPEAIWHSGGKVTRASFSGLAKDVPTTASAFRFVGVDDHYFIVAALGIESGTVHFSGFSHPYPESGGKDRQLVSFSLRAADQKAPVRFYVGPKAFDTMKAVDAEFVRAINFGFWSWLAVPFLGVLKWIYGFVGNWGWAIVLLTVLMNIVIFPLRHKTAISMRKMQEIQPQMKAIQDRYAGLKATDPARQKMNTEVMALYREKGVNPVSGCVPTLLTFPLLFAFYSLLSESIELRSAPFALWIRDLSTHDPLFVTPVLMGAAMLWQQWITPATGDPAQRRMMMLMPVIFVGMFLTLPSGLAIYYFVNTIWGIGQQYFTNWLLGPAVVAQVRPAAERRVKQAGSGRSNKLESKS